MNAMFRVDANSEMGIGHVMRCLTLANFLSRNRYKCIFFCKPHKSFIWREIEKLGHDVVEIDFEEGFSPFDQYSKWLGSTEEWDAEECIRKGKVKKFDIIVVDHYALSSHWERKIRSKTDCLIAIDDLSNRNHFSDLLIDSALGRKQSDYKELVEKDTEILVGSDYVVLRPEFYQAKVNYSRSDGKNNKNSIVIGFGGTDPDKLILIALKAIKEAKVNYDVDILITSSCHWIEELKLAVGHLSNVKLNIDCENISEILLNAKFSISAAGGSLWERFCLSVPTIAVQVADNQKFMIDELLRKGAVLKVDKETIFEDLVRLLLNPKFDAKLAKLKHTSSKICDGLGLYRVVNKIDSELLKVQLRQMTQEDKLLLFRWQNEPGMRQYSLNPSAPSWQEHEQWFEQSLTNKKRRMWRVDMDSIPVGYIRLDDESDYEVISILISDQFRKMNLAAKAIKEVKQLSKYGIIEAEVDSDNAASNALFLKSQFNRINTTRFRWQLNG